MTKKWTFPGGERGVDISDAPTLYNDYVINVNFKSSDDLIDLMLEVDAARRFYKSDVKIHAVIKYFPYARQDRVMKVGESHSLRVIADLINSLKLDKVTVVDPHSDVVEALINNLNVIRQHEALSSTIEVMDYDYLIAPDAGALKKIYKSSELFNIPVICAKKTRIHGGEVKVDLDQRDFYRLQGKKILVVDDICDGGRTFTELAMIFPLSSSPDLYVTHGIFSKGKDELLRYYNNIFCYNDLSLI